jgi:nitroreductase
VDVTDAVHRRSSIRQFMPTPVGDDELRALLADASRAPSGGNLQPWRVYVVNGPSMARMREYLATQPPLEPTEYDIYPSELVEPYRTNRFTVGEQMYALLGIERDDKVGRFAQFARNADFFGAPAAVFCFVDRRMGPPQWSDLGMFLQTLMLLAVERGLATCAQEYWSVRHGAIRSFVGASDEEMLFCGVSIGHADPDAVINSLRSDRMPVEEWARFV